MPSTYEPIATTTLGSATNSYTFSSIPSTYTDLVVVVSYINSAASNILGRYNGDTGSNYSWTYLDGNGSSATSGRGANQTIMNLGYAFGASNQNNAIIQIMNYSNTTTNKTSITRQNNPAGYVSSTVNLWRNTAAITSMTISCDTGNFNTGSTFTLYGIKAA